MEQSTKGIIIRHKPCLYPLRGKWYLTIGELIVDWGCDEVDVIPSFEITDGASIPLWLRWLLPWHTILLAALWHDYKRGHSSKDTFAIDADFKALCEYELIQNGYRPLVARALALSAFYGVRVGYYTSFTNNPPESVLKLANEFTHNIT